MAKAKKKKAAKPTSEKLVRLLDKAFKSFEVKDKYPEEEEEGISYDWDFCEKAVIGKEQWVSPVEIYSSMLDYLYKNWPKDDDDSNQLRKGKLTRLLKPEQYEKFKIEFFDTISSIPMTYTFLVRMPAMEERVENLVISSKLSIVSLKQSDSLLEVKVKNKFPMLGAYLGSDNQFKIDDVLIFIKATGFFRGSINNSAANDAISNLKHFLYFGKLAGVVGSRPANSSWGGARKSAIFVIDEKQDPRLATEMEISQDFAEYLGQFTIVGEADKLSLEKNHLLNRLAGLMDRKPDDIDAAPLKIAAEWAFDSDGNSHGTLSAVQVCVALEAILGDEVVSQGSITLRLADRCSYLVAQKNTERREIREKFKKLYDVRSKIVHGTVTHLSFDHQISIRWGRWILKKILEKELSNFPTDKRYMVSLKSLLLSKMAK